MHEKNLIILIYWFIKNSMKFSAIFIIFDFIMLTSNSYFATSETLLNKNAQNEININLFYYEFYAILKFEILIKFIFNDFENLYI